MFKVGDILECKLQYLSDGFNDELSPITPESFLRKGQLYKVVKVGEDKPNKITRYSICHINNEKHILFISDMKCFQLATQYIRNEKINQILDK